MSGLNLMAIHPIFFIEKSEDRQSSGSKKCQNKIFCQSIHHVLRCFSQDEARSMSDNHFVNCGNLQRLAVKDVKEEWLQYELHFSLFKMWQQQKFIINSQFLFL